MPDLSRRSLFKLAGLGAAAGQPRLNTRAPSALGEPEAVRGWSTRRTLMGPVGRVSTDVFDPAVFSGAWNFSDLPAAERARFYRETPRPDGSLLREYDHRRRRSRDRDRAGHLLSGVDVQRPGARARRSARPKATASGSPS